MRIRHIKYADFGLSRLDSLAVLAYCMNANDDDIRLIDSALEEVNVDYRLHIRKSLLTGMSYDKLCGKYDIFINFGDFYAYRRQAICLIYERLLNEDPTVIEAWREKRLKRRYSTTIEAAAELAISEYRLMKMAREAQAIIKFGNFLRVDMGKLYAFLDEIRATK